MANKYDRWVPTQYVESPIDYYQGALALQEQRSEDALNNVKKAVDLYASINPVSADPQALYDQTIGTLRQGAAEIAKMELTTPEAQKRIQALINDPNIVSNLEGIHEDALLAAQRRKELQEYLKKNPEVNAVHYNVAFNKLGREKGDAGSFDRNRFKNMAPLVDYVDPYKAIDDLAGKLKGNKEKVTVIRGNKYVTTSTDELSKQELRELAYSRAQMDPLIRGQLQRNLQYAFYQADPYDLDNGKKMVTQGMREAVASNIGSLQQHVAEITKGKTKQQIAGDPRLMAAIASARDEIEYYGTLADMEKMNDDQFLDHINRATYGKAFDAHAYKNTEYSEKETQSYLLGLNDMYARRRMMLKKKWEDEKLAQQFGGAPMLDYDTRSQDELTPDKWRDIVGGVTELTGVKLDQHGFLTKESTEKFRPGVEVLLPGQTQGGQSAVAGTMTTRPAAIRKGVANDDIVYGNPNDAKYRGWTQAKDKNGKTVLIKPGAQMVDVTGKSAFTGYKVAGDGKSYEQSIQKLKAFIDDKGVNGKTSADYDWSSSTGVQAALKDIVTFQTNFESSYAPIYYKDASYSERAAQNIMTTIGNARITEGRNEITSPGERARVEKYVEQNLLKSKKPIGFMPYDPALGTAAYHFRLDGKRYTVQMFPQHQQQMLGLTMLADDFRKNNYRPTTMGKDLVIRGMGTNGQANVMVVGGGATKEYQTAAKQQHQENINALKSVGYSEKQAEEYLRRNFAKINETLETNDAKGEDKGFEITGPNGKKVELQAATTQQDNKYYSDREILKGYKNSDLGAYSLEHMNSFFDSKNPYMWPWLQEFVPKKDYYMGLSAEEGSGDGIISHSEENVINMDF